MAENKKSFILYCDQRGTFNKLSDEQAGALIKHVFSYVNDENPVGDFVTELAFEGIKNALKRDLKSWELQQEQRKEAGRKSAEIRQRNATSVQRNSTTVDERLISSTVNDNVNVNVNVSENEIKETKVLPIGNNAPDFSQRNERLAKAMETVIPYLNSKAGTSFKQNNKATERLIAARLKEGYGWSDFKTVIDNKVAEWIGNKEMKPYLRPSTLFGTKFEAYLQTSVAETSAKIKMNDKPYTR
jgi:uncharacterized phage protein (TIGR02220 family)